MRLDSTMQLEFKLGAAGTATSFTAFAITDNGTAYTEIVNSGVSNGTTVVAIHTAPAGGSTKVVKSVNIFNADTVLVNVTIQIDVSATKRVLRIIPLNQNECIQYSEKDGWRVFDSDGALKPGSGGRLVRAPQILVGGTSYTIPAGCKRILVRAWGAGGSGGGGDSNGAATGGVGGGGAAGAYCEKWYENPPSTAMTYAIGASVLGGAGNNPGNPGGDTTFTDGVTLITAKGGLGGLSMLGAATDITVLGGVGVIATNGDINAPGQCGGFGRRVSGTVGVGGKGGSSSVGGGGSALNTHNGGFAAQGYAAGGGGACSLNNAGDTTGGQSTAGLIIIEEYT